MSDHDVGEELPGQDYDDQILVERLTRPPWKPEQWQTACDRVREKAARRLHADGVTYRDLAALLGCTHRQVSYRLYGRADRRPDHAAVESRPGT